MHALPGRGMQSRGSPGAATQEDDLQSVEQNAEIQDEGSMLDVIEIVLHLLDLLLQVVRVDEADLRPPRDPWSHGGAQGVVRDLLHEERVMDGRMRSRPDQ